MPTSFGQVISVTGPGLGFQGTVSRQGERVIAARVYNPTTSTNNLNFGDPAVLVGDTAGGKWDSVADFVATVANIAKVASQFAGMAVREVQTQLSYTYSHFNDNVASFNAQNPFNFFSPTATARDHIWSCNCSDFAMASSTCPFCMFSTRATVYSRRRLQISLRYGSGIICARK